MNSVKERHSVFLYNFIVSAALYFTDVVVLEKPFRKCLNNQSRFNPFNI